VYVDWPSAPVVTVHPSTVVVAAELVGVVVLGETVERDDPGEDDPGDDEAARLGGRGVKGGVSTVGVGCPATAGGRSSGGVARPGAAVRSTGCNATVATPMLARVAAHHPSTGRPQLSRMRPLNHRP
jgi:hypothetical protein